MNPPRKLYLILYYVFARTTPRFWQLIQNRMVSYFFFLFWRRMRRILQGNLAIVLGLPPDARQVRAVVRRAFQNYGLYLLDYVQINRLNAENFEKTVAEEHGTEYIKEALDEGKGAILVTPHLGNWELGGVSFALKNCPVYALTLKDSETEVQTYRDSVRGSLGIRTVHLDPDDYGTVIKLAGLLKQNKVIAMLGDRWEGGKKSVVSFFGQRVAFPGGAAALALATGAPIIPVFVTLRPDGRYKAWMEAPIRVVRRPGQDTGSLLSEKTQELATVFERAIRAYPDQWYHFFDYWSRYRSEDTPG
jgi:KDO2-lipid IV(A) lauroyltransferase